MCYLTTQANKTNRKTRFYALKYTFWARKMVVFEINPSLRVQKRTFQRR